MRASDQSNESGNLVDTLIDEGLQPVSQALASFGIHVSAWTAIRWARVGVRGRRLQSVKIGGKWFSSRAAVRRFLAADRAPDPSTSNPRRASKRATEQFLEGLGLSREDG